ncbi:AI-2E family transporter [Brachybacterium huguangmaarense]|uniref:AI-2E family transporter n=1 Tax=Brachybacterium huguangmaarense TaxID=1652028 RepID=A0ABY6G3M0_9MICO|nr:AI-2E family transporter [Brachybacterium huguangmaarense]UYG17559.1 AI-2E family transporter [Brachybacterium huguangmaarense]
MSDGSTAAEHGPAAEAPDAASGPVAEAENAGRAGREPASSRQTDAPAGRRVPRALSILVGLAAAWIVLSGMQQLAGLIVPVFLALNLMIAVHPLGAAIDRAGLPRIVGALANMLTVLVALVVFFGAIGWAIAQLVTELPHYSDRFNTLLGEALDIADGFGVSQDQLTSWISAVNVSSLVGMLNQALNSVGSVSALLTATVATIVFFGLDATGLPERLAVVERHHGRDHAALLEFAHSARTYWIVTTLFGAVVAVIDGFALWLLGVPLPGVWAVLLFLCNYIPNIGFVFALIPPTLMALLDRGPWTAVAVVVICSTIAMLLQGLVQPRVTGRAVGLAPSISFLSVLFWSWVLGAAGALLSVPMTLLVKELLIDADPQARWLNAFLADDASAAETAPSERVRPAPGSPR